MKTTQAPAIINGLTWDLNVFSSSLVTVVIGELSLIDTEDKLVETDNWFVPIPAILLAGVDEDVLVTVFDIVLICPEMKQCSYLPLSIAPRLLWIF